MLVELDVYEMDFTIKALQGMHDSIGLMVAAEKDKREKYIEALDGVINIEGTVSAFDERNSEALATLYHNLHILLLKFKEANKQ